MNRSLLLFSLVSPRAAPMSPSGTLRRMWASSLRHGVRLLGTTAALRSSDRIVPADSLICWDARKPVRLRMEDTVPGNYPSMLVQTMMKNTVQRWPDQKALAIKRDGQWQTWSYSQYYEEVQKVAKGFLALGLTRFHGVGIMGANTPEEWHQQSWSAILRKPATSEIKWFMSCVGAILAGGLSCGIYSTNSPEAVSYIGMHAPLDILVVEDEDMLTRVLGGRNVRVAFPQLKGIVLMTPLSGGPVLDLPVMAWQDLLEIGARQPEFMLKEAQDRQAVNEACMLVYTSGTTGPPKGAILSHDNVTYSCRVSMEHHEWADATEVVMSYLPLSHIAAVMIDCFMVMSKGGTTYFADKDALRGTLVENLKEVRPTRFVGVPRVWEKIQERMQETARQSGPLKRAVANWAKNAATEQHQAVREGRRKTESLSYKLAKRLVFSRIREALGLDKAAVGSGAAPLAVSTFHYFESLDMPLLELLGSTETTGPQTTNMPGVRLRPGTVGKSYYGVRNAIHNPDQTGLGELITCGRNVFMGYQNDEERTKAAFTDEFWLRSGDLAKFDQDGFLTVTGRLKEIIITAGGKNIAPMPIEEAIKKELADIVSYAVLVGDKRKFLTCLLTLRVNVDEATLQPTQCLTESARAWAESKIDGSVKTVDDFLSGPFADTLRSAMQSSLDAVNENALSRAQRVQKFCILPKELSVQGGELGPTLKLKRFYVYDKYRKDIDQMYE